MEFTLIDVLASGGPVAVLAGIIFVMYRRDVNNHREQWQEITKELLQCRKDDIRSRDDGTRATTELTVAIRFLSERRGND